MHLLYYKYKCMYFVHREIFGKLISELKKKKTTRLKLYNRVMQVCDS